MSYTPIRCKDCDQDITHKVQYFDKGEVRCEVCNYRKGCKEYPTNKLSPKNTLKHN